MRGVLPDIAAHPVVVAGAVGGLSLINDHPDRDGSVWLMLGYNLLGESLTELESVGSG